MSITTTQKNILRTSRTGFSGDTNGDVRFIADLGRSLLFTVHPKKVASRVVEAVRQRVGAEICAIVAHLDNIGIVSCSFDAKGEMDPRSLTKAGFDRWLSLLPPQVAYGQENEADFLIENGGHGFEYISPLHINGVIGGVIVAGFRRKSDFDETKGRVIEAATQMAAMSINLSAHYEAAINTSISRAREEHRKFTEAVLDALPVSLYVVDRDYRIVTWNKHREIGEQGIPREAALGRDVFSVLERYPKQQIRREFERTFSTGNIDRVEQQTVSADGSIQHWQVSKIPMKNADTGEVTHVISVGEDVTARVAATHAVARAEKLAAVGRLAAGVVHEINNPLATIAACAEALEQRITEGAFEMSDAEADLAEYLGLIKSETFRCKSITTGLLDFSRSRTGDRHPIDVEELLRSSANLISHQKRGDLIKIEVESADGLPAVIADGGQIQQAIIALATNAIDAMPNGGKLTFRARPHRHSVAIEVEDTGSGIAQEDLSKIFEPFFTTKEVGEGTGLGLAVCYGIITDHGGRLSVRSNLGKGTVFTILLPITPRN